MTSNQKDPQNLHSPTDTGERAALARLRKAAVRVEAGLAAWAGEEAARELSAAITNASDVLRALAAAPAPTDTGERLREARSKAETVIDWISTTGQMHAHSKTTRDVSEREIVILAHALARAVLAAVTRIEDSSSNDSTELSSALSDTPEERNG